MTLNHLRRVALALLFGVASAPLVLGADPNQQSNNQWWRKAVIYEIYPRSFGDTSGDGIGDLNGITQHLDYLRDLGIDAIWIAPFFPSPQVDFGYDISDYRAIDPQYGTMADFDRLVAEAKKRNIRILLDFVVNHTSDKHPWFIESKSSRTNPKANWYMWNDGKANRQPPNNWASIFGHSAWEWVPERRQFYYHAFYKEQPDLNWTNREVRNAMYDVMRFWMKKGAAGFRLDAVTTMFEDPQLRDEPIKEPGTNAYGDPILTRQYTDNLPGIHEVFREMRRVTDEFPDGVLIGEVYVPTVQDLARMYGAQNDELQLPMDTQLGFINHLSADEFRTKLREAETGINGHVPLLVFSNHDNPRSWNRYGDGKNDPAIAKLIATTLLTPRGVALMYYGEEIGMENNDPKSKDDVRDPIGRTGWPREKGRDGERTPMQWNADTNAGFSTARTTWLPAAPSYKTRNVAAESQEPTSMLNYYKALIRLRRTNPAMRDGDFVLVNEADKNVLAFLRRAPDGKTVLVALNFTPSAQKLSFDLHGVPGTQASTLLSSFSKEGQSSSLKDFSLPPYGSYIGQVQ
jgi:alpha-glucosidase